MFIRFILAALVLSSFAKGESSLYDFCITKLNQLNTEVCKEKAYTCGGLIGGIGPICEAECNGHPNYDQCLTDCIKRVAKTQVYPALQAMNCPAPTGGLDIPHILKANTCWEFLEGLRTPACPGKVEACLIAFDEAYFNCQNICEGSSDLQGCMTTCMKLQAAVTVGPAMKLITCPQTPSIPPGP